MTHSRYTNGIAVYVQTYDSTSHHTVTAQTNSIKSLCGKLVSTVSVLSATEPRPAGCVAFTVSSSAAVFLYVKDRVDIDAEIAKAAKKLEKTQIGIDKQKKILDDPGYKEKVSKELQDAERKKLADLEAEKKGFEETINQFEKLKFE
jgi:valyl-tRNA synthetase